MTIRAVIWDLGGVLLRTENHAPREQLAARLGITYDDLYRLIFESDSSHLASVGKITTETHWETVRKALKLSREEFPTVPYHFWGGDRLDTGLVEYIRSLKPAYKTGLLSNAWDDLHYMLVEKWHIADAFDEIIISAEVGVTKPDPLIYKVALQRLGVLPSEVVFIDDFLNNIEGARAVNMHTIHFRSAKQARAELEQILKGDDDGR